MSDINISNPPSDPVNPGTVQPTTGGDPFSSEIDAIFGSPKPDEVRGGEPSLETNPFKDTSTNAPDYGNMSPEQLAKMFQSKYDITQANLDKATSKLQEYESLEDFIDSVYDDEEVRHAFLSEIAPDLVATRDPYAALEEQLRKEFGDDFVPDDEEAKRPFTKTWKYYKRADDLEKQIQNKKTSVPGSLKELRAEKERKKKESSTKALQEKDTVLRSMKWSDNDFNSFAQWVGKLSATDLAKIYTYANSRRPQHSPNMVNQSGGITPSPNALMAELDKFFG